MLPIARLWVLRAISCSGHRQRAPARHKATLLLDALPGLCRLLCICRIIRGIADGLAKEQLGAPGRLAAAMALEAKEVEEQYLLRVRDPALAEQLR